MFGHSRRPVDREWPTASLTTRAIREGVRMRMASSDDDTPSGRFQLADRGHDLFGWRVV
jgi:hypothetical protein